MSLYSAIQFTSVSFLYAKASNLGDFQFLFIDLLLILPIAIFMGWAGPASALSRKRPSADLVSRKVLVPLMGLMIICILMQAITYITVKEQPWYKPPKVKHEHSNIRNSENTVLFLMSCFEYIFSGVVLNAGPPFRERTLRNCELSPYRQNMCMRTDKSAGPFAVTIASAILITFYLTILPGAWVTRTMQLTSMSWHYKMFLVLLGVAYLIISLLFERYLAKVFGKHLGRWKERVTGKRKQRKAYKAIEDEMRTR